MGEGKDVEAAPLLGQNLETGAVKEARTWRQQWYHVLGNGSPLDVAACCLSWHAPFVAFGWNSERGLHRAWWKDALRFLLLTVGMFLVGRGVMCAVTMMACPPCDRDSDMGPPRGFDGMRPQHPHMGPGMGGSNMMGEGMADVGMKWNMDGHAKDSRDSMWRGKDFHGDDDVDNFMGDDDFPEMRECMTRVFPAAIAVGLVTVLGLAALIVYAARTRTLLRERFGIPGSTKEDYCLWTFCGPCALAQETRTLMHNNVDSGLWHGAYDAPAVVLTN